MERMTKSEKVKRYMQEYGKINSWEAIKEFGATRLSAIIFNFRHKNNMNIVSQRRQFIDRYGDKSYFVDYILKQDDEEKDDDEKEEK